MAHRSRPCATHGPLNGQAPAHELIKLFWQQAFGTCPPILAPRMQSAAKFSVPLSTEERHFWDHGILIEGCEHIMRQIFF
ncbi:hypothetical protein MRA01_62840 [Methylobacterium radiotolerans]|nr:hypothetical protein MRA01_62840 [Methylobacterium radiotolerans]